MLYDEKIKVFVIGFDMGGISIDVLRYGDGRYDYIFEIMIVGVIIQFLQLDINIVVVGGGLRLFFKNGLFVVGFDFVGVYFGFVCY